MALVSYPEVQKKAFAEIDAVIGSGRIPSLDDMDELPYVKALIREVHRYRPVFPMAIPHASLQDETVRYPTRLASDCCSLCVSVKDISFPRAPLSL